MSKQCGTKSGNLSDMPRYIQAGIGVSREWMINAYCAGETSSVAWRVSPADRVFLDGSKYMGAELIAYAEAVCEMCPAQWECARYAVRTEASVGTWGVRFDLLRWLLESGLDPITVIDEADELDVTVQEALSALQASLANVA